MMSLVFVCFCSYVCCNVLMLFVFVVALFICHACGFNSLCRMTSMITSPTTPEANRFPQATCLLVDSSAQPMKMKLGWGGVNKVRLLKLERFEFYALSLYFFIACMVSLFS